MSIDENDKGKETIDKYPVSGEYRMLPIYQKGKEEINLNNIEVSVEELETLMSNHLHTFRLEVVEGDRIESKGVGGLADIDCKMIPPRFKVHLRLIPKPAYETQIVPDISNPE